MQSLRRIPKRLYWALCLSMVAVCIIVDTGTSRAQFLKSLFHRDKPSPAPQATESDNRVKQRYDALTRGESYDRDQLLATVHPYVEKQFQPVTGIVPQVPGAEMVNDDSLCATCHEAYVQHHRTNIHRNQSCEACHGPASEHLKTRGTKPGTIVNFKNLKPADQAEICLHCHEKHAPAAARPPERAVPLAGQPPAGGPAAPGGAVPGQQPLAQKEEGFPGQKWRTSTHAHAEVSCVQCHRNHYNVPPGTAATKVGGGGGPEAPKEADIQAIRSTYEKLGASDPHTCNQCHQDLVGAPRNAPKIANMLVPGAHQINGPNKMKCTTCHDPHGVLRKEVRTDLCLQCHNGHRTAPWAGSSHARAGMACVDCHNPHVPSPKLAAADSNTCLRCHTEKSDLAKVAHPHQINGVKGFACVTCHNPHDNVRQEIRVDQCLTCHKGHPVQAWKSTTHSMRGVACTDCHNPHPNSRVPAIVNVDHNQVDRPKRMPMSVDEPLVCYRCHTKIAALFQLPYHHPVPEGKMVCSKCHDSHGGESADKLLKEPTVNLTCFKCHSEKQGPFAWEHPPVTENCMICHNPHGTVTKQLLKQPTTFLCLRCHSGHNGSHHAQLATPATAGGKPIAPLVRQGFYTECSLCHSQVHGSNLPPPDRAGPRLQR